MFGLNCLPHFLFPVLSYLFLLSPLSFLSPVLSPFFSFFLFLSHSGKAIPEIRDQFLLMPAEKYKYINQSGCYKLDDVDDVQMFEQTRLAFTVLNISPELSDGIFSVLSAILYIGNLVFEVCSAPGCVQYF